MKEQTLTCDDGTAANGFAGNNNDDVDSDVNNNNTISATINNVIGIINENDGAIIIAINNDGCINGSTIAVNGTIDYTNNNMYDNTNAVQS